MTMSLTVAGPLIILSVIFFIGLLAVLKVTAYRREQDAYQKQLKDARDQYSNVIEGKRRDLGVARTGSGTSINEKWAEMLGYTEELSRSPWIHGQTGSILRTPGLHSRK